MPMLKSCVERLDSGQLCGELSESTRCVTHRRAYEKRRNEEEPWRAFYDDPRWFRARMKRREMDEHRCTFTYSGRRCANTDLLECHHTEKVRDIWARMGRPLPGSPRWNKFVLECCDLRKLRMLCPRCHKNADTTRERPTPPRQNSSASRRDRKAGKRAIERRNSRKRRSQRGQG